MIHRRERLLCYSIINSVGALCVYIYSARCNLIEDAVCIRESREIWQFHLNSIVLFFIILFIGKDLIISDPCNVK